MSDPTRDLWLENDAVGQRSRLVLLPGETGGRKFVLEYINRPFGGEKAVPAHVHPTYKETFQILAGRARYRVGTETRDAAPGDVIVMPAGLPHVHPWSISDEELYVRQTTESETPDMAGMNAGLQAAITIQGLARAGRVNAQGLPNLLQTAVLIETTMPATYLDGSPILLQRVLFGALAGIGRLAGYKTAYPQYGRLTAAGLELPT